MTRRSRSESAIQRIASPAARQATRLTVVVENQVGSSASAKASRTAAPSAAATAIAG